MLQSKTQIARRVAFGAVPQCGRQVRTALPLRRFGRIGGETLILEERSIPKSHHPTLIERKGKIVRAIDRVALRQAEQVGLDGEYIVAAQLGVRSVRKRRVQMLA